MILATRSCSITKTKPMAIQEKPIIQDKITPCQVTYHTADQPAGQGTSVNFHERGMLIRCSKPAPLNRKLKLVLKFPSIEQSFEVQGIVVWTNIHGSADDLTPRAMGIKFLNLDRNVERLLAKLASHYNGQGGPYSCYYS